MMEVLHYVSIGLRVVAGFFAAATMMSLYQDGKRRTVDHALTKFLVVLLLSDYAFRFTEGW